MNNVSGASSGSSSGRSGGRVFVTMERNEFERIVFENVQMKLEKEIFERKMMVVVVVLCMVMVGFSKLFG
ncbi:hypothetical protein Bca52824_053694 [Brassica carinata]|uniref:Transmembrane protein n=1 Tax=Brassica carinata TaxID=52824 RepID=A0A8X7RC37_BRACI|nr:hypothetical protein Bca52824_053694 [Brassica carinata]